MCAGPYPKGVCVCGGGVTPPVLRHWQHKSVSVGKMMKGQWLRYASDKIMKKI